MGRFKLAIRFGDNDFAKTFKALLKIISEYPEGYDLSSKEKIVALFNKAIPGIFWLVQNRGIDRQDWDPSSYLRLEEKNIFLNKEVDDFLAENTWDNYEFHVLDTTGHEPYMYSV